MGEMRSHLGIVAVVVLIAGCAPSGGASAGSSGGGASTSPVAAQSIAPSVVSSSAATSAAVAVTTVTDPDMSIRLPTGWRAAPVAMLRSRAEQAAAATTGAIKEAYEQLIRDIDANSVRLFASGPTGVDPWQGTIVIEVTDAGSLEAQIDRVEKLQTAFAKPTTSQRTEVKLAVGSGVRLEQTADPPGGQGVPARGINFVIKLEDGRILWINTTAPEASKTFAAMIDGAVESISRR